ncbi:MAG TPA: type I DNA topoisomerase [Armatimonadota bacterium]|jgi:DNA topoisomerase-1
MSKSLIIVESPAKIKTLKNILGPGYDVRASMGHVRDLPKSKLSIDVDNDFAPTYTIIPDKTKVIKDLREAAKDKETVFLASDPDREGEAIAWHLSEALHLKNAVRIQFNEITRSAVEEAIRHPRTVDKGRVDAQQARRVLDRLVGYKLSPLLWKKIKRNLSAGRVQSVALRLICDREREILAFVPVEYWSITASVTPQAKKHPFDAKLIGRVGTREKLELHNQAEADDVLAALKGSAWSVGSVKKSERKVNPYAPFITSTLQQEASRKLGMSNKKTMAIAQQLYEGVDLGAEGSVGLITYMRTDSTRVAKEAQEEALHFITETYGAKYAPLSPRVYRSRNTAQDAHEAIRPTSAFRRPEAIKARLTTEQFKMYDLIWKRFVSSQMHSGVDEVTTVDVHATHDGSAFLFRASGTVQIFDGFRRVYTVAKDEDEKTEDEFAQKLPALAAHDLLDLLGITPRQHFTEPLPRYNPATLVKTLEENGVGRPSTYATIVGTVQDRGYVELREKRFYPTELGFAVNDLLVKHFPKIVDVQFTSGMEGRLDRVEDGSENWVAIVREFYVPFEIAIGKAETEAERVKMTPKVLEGEVCPECGKELHIRQGRFGEFIGCSGFPDCKYTRPITVKIGVECPREGCTGEIVEKKSKSKAGKDYKFYGCSRYPECDFTTFYKPLPDKFCDTCGYNLGEDRMGRRLMGIKCTNKACPTNAKPAAKADPEADAEKA